MAFVRLLVLLIFIAASFFCSNSPFDTETDLGTDVINGLDSLFTNFDGKKKQDTLTSTNNFSFTDRSDSLLSGLIKLNGLAIGTWRNEKAIAYIEFDADSLDSLIARQDGILNALNLNLIPDNSTLFYTNNTQIELGYCRKKQEHAYLDTNRLIPLALQIIDTSSTVSFPLKSFKTDTSFITDTSTIRNTSFMVIANKFNFISNKTHIDTSYTAETIIYDSITPLLSLIIGSEILIDSSSNQDTLGDTVLIYDTVKTVHDTSFFQIIPTIQHITIGQNTIDTIIYDTTRITLTTHKTKIQRVRISPKMTFKTHIIDSLRQVHYADRDSTRNLRFYLRLKEESDSSLMISAPPYLNMQFIESEMTPTDTSFDTVHVVLLPQFFDYTVFEDSTSVLVPNSGPLSSGAAGRIAVIAFDLNNFWQQIKDDTDRIKYKNIPRAELTLELESIGKHSLMGVPTTLYYTMLGTQSSSLEHLDTVRSIMIDTLKTTESIKISLAKDLRHILHNQNPLPERGYLYLWLAKNQFAQIRWKISPHFSFEYILLNSQ